MATTTTTATDTFTWPKPAKQLLAAYLKARVSGAADAPHQGLPFITEASVLRVKPSDWIAWLETQDIDAPKKPRAPGTQGRRPGAEGLRAPQARRRTRTSPTSRSGSTPVPRRPGPAASLPRRVIASRGVASRLGLVQMHQSAPTPGPLELRVALVSFDTQSRSQTAPPPGGPFCSPGRVPPPHPRPGPSSAARGRAERHGRRCG